MTHHPYHDVVRSEQEHHHGAWIDAARDMARAVALVHGRVTSDDIWQLCPPPSGVDPRVMGAVFSDKQTWRKTGYINSRRRECHCRPIALWELVQ